ncbi:MAG: hypothetical protein JWM74_801, partial [Myxococcaceae bacterium]|nr:hypothetical protein [Myxococcaceae bacterium]
MKNLPDFPPAPRGMKGRAAELTTLARTIEVTHPARLALVGAGGSGKSMLACALGYRLAARFGDRVHWCRVGAWDFRTLAEMLAVRFGTPRDRASLVPSLRRFLMQGGDRLIVLDNHEDDRVMARFLDELGGTPVTFVVTARRCLLSGVLIFPVTAPLVTSGRHAFPRVATLTRLLRWNPLALDIADAIVASERAATTESELGRYLQTAGVDHIKTIAHEDDLPEVALLVAWAWSRLGVRARRMLGVLAHIDGDHMDLASLAELADVRTGIEDAITQLAEWHLVQEPMARRYALHAVVRYAVATRTTADRERVFRHYVTLLEKHPERAAVEQTHLFAALDHAHRSGNVSAILRVEALL